MTSDLGRMLRPKSIALIGGGSIIKYVRQNCDKIGFSGPVWHVHPTKGDATSVPELPQAPDLAFVGVNRFATLDVVAQLREIGAGGAVAYASGFLEAEAEVGDGAELQQKLLDAAGGMPLIGPNCYGFLNYLDGAGLWPDQQGGERVERGVAIITQSSNIAINLTMQRRGLPLAYVMTAGNQAQLGLADLGRAVLQDDRVTALGLHIEGIGDLRAFEALALDARNMGKSIVALKAGRSEQAQAATISHTASLAGSSAGSDALFRRLGVGQVKDLSTMLETLKLLHLHGPLRSNRIASMSCSGGEASLMADLGSDGRLIYPELSPEQRQGLRTALGPKVALANPLDYHTYIWADQPAMAQTYSAMMAGDLALGVVVADFPRTDRCTDQDWEPVIQGVRAASNSTGKPMAVVSCLAENLPENTAKRLMDYGVAPLCGMADGLAAIETAVSLGKEFAPPQPLMLPKPSHNPRVILEAEAKGMLRQFGVVSPRSVRCTNQTLIEASQEIGFPCVLKGEGVAHKTEAGAVVVNVNTLSELLDRASKMPGGSFLLEEMIADGIVEILVGVTLDPAHGYLLTIAAGGTLTEILKDRISLLLPVEDDQIRCEIQNLGIAPMINGYRGKPEIDMEALVLTIRGVVNFVQFHQGRVEEVEINPVICGEFRAVDADALIRMGDKEG